MSFKERIKNLKEDVPALFLCLKDSNTPLIAKVLATICVGYALSPIDLVPDFIPVLGYLDDILILPLLVYLTLKFIPKEVFEKNKALSKDMWTNGKPKKWYYAIPIVAIWVIIIILIINKKRG